MKTQFIYPEPNPSPPEIIQEAEFNYIARGTYGDHLIFAAFRTRKGAQCYVKSLPSSNGKGNNLIQLIDLKTGHEVDPYG